VKHLDYITLILSDARGIYIPRDFLTDDYNNIAWEHCNAWGLNESNVDYWMDAVNPESEGYWDAWMWVCDNARFTDAKGNVYILHQDGDLWSICYERMTDEEKQNFGFEE
jgi:hypothetical protein